MRNIQDLYEAVIKNSKYGFYELAQKYRRKMDDFYKNEYYQDNHALYQHTEYDEIDLEQKKNFYAQKQYVAEKWGGIHRKGIDFLMWGQAKDTRLVSLIIMVGA